MPENTFSESDLKYSFIKTENGNEILQVTPYAIISDINLLVSQDSNLIKGRIQIKVVSLKSLLKKRQ